jgi:hypothetical protein
MHGAIDSTTGILMRVSFEQAQLEVGISVPFLSASFDFYGVLLTDSWWRFVWEFTWRHCIQLPRYTSYPPTERHIHHGAASEPAGFIPVRLDFLQSVPFIPPGADNGGHYDWLWS